MFTLYSLGPAFVSYCGPRAFVLTWIASSVAGCGLNLWWEDHGRKIPFVAAILQQQNTKLAPERGQFGGAIGASGSIFGLMTGLALAAPYLEMMIFPLPVPIRLWTLNAVAAGLSGYFLVTNTFPAIGHAGHLGGMAGGLACGALLLRR